MKKTFNTTVLCLIISVIMIFSSCFSAFGSDIDHLINEAAGLEEYLRQLTVNITQLTMKQEFIQTNINDVSQKITENESLLEEANTAKEHQYDLMKKRIKYLYESGNTNYIEAILSSDNISDALNRFEYIDKIVGYDREMLDRYALLISTVEDLQTQLNEKKEQLSDLKDKAAVNLNEASAVTGAASGQVMEYGISQEDAKDIVSGYIAEYEDEIREEIQQELDRKQEEDPGFNWLEDDIFTQEEEYDTEVEVTEPEEAVQLSSEEEISDETQEIIGEITETVPETSDKTESDITEETTPEQTTGEKETKAAREKTTEEKTTEEKTTQENTTEEKTTQEKTTEEETTTLPEITFESKEETSASKDTEKTDAKNENEQDEKNEESDKEDEIQDSGEISDAGYSDAYLIACMLSGEVGYSSYETQWAVADLIMNLVESPSWPGTVYDVLHCPGVFDAVNWWYIPGTSVPSYLYYISNGPMDSCLSAAYDAISNRGASHGYKSYCADWYYEDNPDIFEDTYGEIIGSEYFYNWNWD